MREYNNDVDISIFFNKRRVLLVHLDGGTGVPILLVGPTVLGEVKSYVYNFLYTCILYVMVG